jgi:pimeloyl-ACP methyl ester carboxylesterase
VLIPGWTLNTRLWDTVLPLLEPFFRVVRYDVRGAGLSTSDPALEHSRMADSEDLLALLDHLAFPRAALVGHSKGARIALVFAMRWPDRVSAVVAAGASEPRPTHEMATTFSPIAAAWLEGVRETARRDGVEKALEQLYRGRLFGKLRTSVEGLRALRKAMEGYQGADLLSTLPPRRFDVRGNYHRLRMPVLFLVGSEDPFLSECRYAHRCLPSSSLKIVSEAGHMLPMEVPGVFSRAVLDFFRGQESDASEINSEALDRP